MDKITFEAFQDKANALRTGLVIMCDLDPNAAPPAVSELLATAFSRASFYNKETPGGERNAVDGALEQFSSGLLNLMMNYAKQDLPDGFDRVPAV